MNEPTIKEQQQTTSKPSPMTIILGGVMFQAEFRDGSKEEIKIRQLPIDLIDQWAALQGDEAGLVELYCDKVDALRSQRLHILNAQELRLLELINQSAPEKFDEIEERLAVLRGKIDALNKIERWDSKLVPESHNEILRIGGGIEPPYLRPMGQRSVDGHRSDEEVERAAAAIPFTDLILDCASILGVTPHEVTGLSPALCELIFQNSERKRARESLLLLQLIRAGTAATSGFVDNGAELFLELEDQLGRDSGYNPEPSENV